jgi:hypothetical protein
MKGQQDKAVEDYKKAALLGEKSAQDALRKEGLSW